MLLNIPTVILFKVGAVARDHDTPNPRFVAVCPIPIASPRDLSFDTSKKYTEENSARKAQVKLE
jgi:hypothetical protein